MRWRLGYKGQLAPHPLSSTGPFVAPDKASSTSVLHGKITYQSALWRPLSRGEENWIQGRRFLA